MVITIVGILLMMNSCDCDYWYTYYIALSAASLIHA